MAKGTRTHLPVVHYLRADFAATTDGLAAGTYKKTLGTLPAGSQIINAISGLYVSEVYNAGTSSLVNIGTSADNDLYMTIVSSGTKAFTALDEAATATGVNAWATSATDDTTITAEVVLAGTNASTGKCTVVIAYVPPVAT
jgi:hypothetical protein